MTVPELIQAVEAAGGVLALKGDRIQYELPEDFAPMIEVLRQCRDEVFRILQESKRPEHCNIHQGQTTWWTRVDGSRVCVRCHPDPNAIVLERTAQSGPPLMPEGVTLLRWAPERPPVAIERWALVNDVPQFIQVTLRQLRAAIAGENWLAGNCSVRELTERLEQVGVMVSVQEIR